MLGRPAPHLRSAIVATVQAWPDLGVGLVVSALAGLATAALCPPVIRWLERRSVLDVPVARSSHDTPTLRGGGLAPAIAMTIAGLAASLIAPRLGLAIVWVAVGFGAIGLLEDLVGVETKKRLASQVLVAAVGLVPLAGPTLDRLEVAIALAVLAVGLVWYVAYVNAFNFMDGINGISGAQATVAGFAYLCIGLLQGEPVLVAFGGIIAAASIGFLPFNFPSARVFLGDTGSYFLGGWLASLAAVALVVGIPLFAVVAPLALYLADTGITLTRRALRGAAVMEPHREHVYQRLVIQGWSHTRATCIVAALIALCSVIGGVALIDASWATPVAAAGLALAVFGYLALPRLQRTAGPSSPAPSRPMMTQGLRHQ